MQMSRSLHGGVSVSNSGINTCVRLDAADVKHCMVTELSFQHNFSLFEIS